MSDYSRFIRWSSGCRNHRSTGGQTAGDTMYLGLTDYDQPFPCPNGLGIDTRNLRECESWRRRIEKAKRDIEAWYRDIAIDERAEALTDDEFEIWFEALTKGRNEHCIEY